VWQVVTSLSEGHFTPAGGSRGAMKHVIGSLMLPGKAELEPSPQVEYESASIARKLRKSGFEDANSIE
jgi:hypothetical protein